MIFAYILSPRPLPPDADAVLSALHATPPWAEVERSAPVDSLWDVLSLVHGTTGVTAHFSLGDAMPAEIRTWMPWAGRALDEATRLLMSAPAATIRVEGPQPLEVNAPSAPSLGVTEPSLRVVSTELDADAEAPLRRVRFVLAVAAALSAVSGGVLVDAQAQRFWSAADVERFLAEDWDVRDFVSVHAELLADDGADDEGRPSGPLLHLHTHGLARFGKPDVEMGEVPQALLPFGTRVLNEVAHHQALGHTLRHRQSVLVDQEYMFGVSGTSRSHEHVGNGMVSLVDPPDAPQRDVRVPRHTLAKFAAEL